MYDLPMGIKILIGYKINLAKFKTAEEYCKIHNIIFEVWTEKSNPYLLKEEKAK
jgi:hypothetical protein